MEWIAKYWIEVLFGMVVTVLSLGIKFVWKKIKSQSDEQQYLKSGLQALLRDRIVQAYYKCVEQKYCPMYMLESISLMYKEYHNLGGNSFVTQLMEELMKFPKIKPDEKNDEK